MKCYQCNIEIEKGSTIIPISVNNELRHLCGIICNSQYEQKLDIEFLLSILDFDSPEDIPKGLSPEFYHGMSYETEVSIAKGIERIGEKYGIPIRGHKSKDDG